MDFSQLPKIELHLHLDCSLSFEVASQLNPALTREAYERDFIAPAKCTNLADFLKRAPQGINLMQTEAQLQAVSEDICKQLAADNVIYAEIRFAPLLHTQGGLSAEAVVEIVESATRKASQANGIETRILLCTLRHFSAGQSMQTVKLVERFSGSSIAALDLAGDEAGFPLTAHIPAFQYAIANNIPRIAHAGEACGPQSIRETLKQLQPARLGHGVRAIEDPTLLEHLRQSQLHLEVCPSCNVQIDIFKGYADHPIDQLYREGLSVGISTDSRAITNITLTEEYRRLRQTFGWDESHFLRCNRNALQASFAPPELKKRLADELERAYIWRLETGD